jgi:hypothetical protein
MRIKKTLDKKTRKKSKNDEQSTNECLYKNAEEKVIKQSHKGNDKKI